MRQSAKCIATRFAALVLLAGLTGAAFGQSAGAGTITGTVKDPSGAVVPGAEVTVKSTDTGIERKSMSNESGIYVAPFLKPGHYEVSASRAGLSTVVRTELSLQVGQTLTIDFSMIVKTAQEIVTVT